MTTIDLNSPVPDIEFAITGNSPQKLTDYHGKVVVLYFYPKDNTPGCTIEAKDFRDNFKEFQKLGIEILGVSRDTVKKHESFKAKYDLPFELISDSEEQLCRAFDVIREKNMFGKKVKGIERSTFLIDKSGIVRKIWRKVSIKGHTNEVLQAALEIK